jgi:RNA polymerase sigma-70 factor (ECF subfamily)
VIRLYDQLMAIEPTQVVALNRAVAVAEVDGPAAALAIVDTLDLAAFHAFHAVRADLLRRLGRLAEAAQCYSTAAGLAGNEAERRFLTAQAAAMDAARPW